MLSCHLRHSHAPVFREYIAISDLRLLKVAVVHGIVRGSPFRDLIFRSRLRFICE